MLGLGEPVCPSKRLNSWAWRCWENLKLEPISTSCFTFLPQSDPKAQRTPPQPGARVYLSLSAATLRGAADQPTTGLWRQVQIGQAEDLVRKVIKADGHADVAWEADVNAKIDQPLSLGPFYSMGPIDGSLCTELLD